MVMTLVPDGKEVFHPLHGTLLLPRDHLIITTSVGLLLFLRRTLVHDLARGLPLPVRADLAHHRQFHLSPLNF